MKPKPLIAIVLILAIGILVGYFLFLLDRTAPDAPVFASPTNGLVVEPTVSFFWYEPERGATYQLQVATDPQFTNIVLSKTGLPPASYDVNAAEALVEGTYYCRVRAIDKLGNVGPWSEIVMFIVKTT